MRDCKVFWTLATFRGFLSLPSWCRAQTTMGSTASLKGRREALQKMVRMPRAWIYPLTRKCRRSLISFRVSTRASPNRLLHWWEEEPRLPPLLLLQQNRKRLLCSCHHYSRHLTPHCTIFSPGCPSSPIPRNPSSSSSSSSNTISPCASPLGRSSASPVSGQGVPASPQASLLGQDCPRCLSGAATPFPIWALTSIAWASWTATWITWCRRCWGRNLKGLETTRGQTVTKVMGSLGCWENFYLLTLQVSSTNQYVISQRFKLQMFLSTRSLSWASILLSDLP